MKKHQKLCVKMKREIDKGKRSKTLNEVKPAENIIKNPQSFLQVNLIQKEIFPSHKLQHHL